MKKIINGRLYDTGTAKALGEWSSMADVRNFHWYKEQLFRKRTGEYFLYGIGGPMSRYAERGRYGGWDGGEAITPLTAAKAREWAEEHLDSDAYAEIFGMPDEGDEVAVLNVQIDAALMARLRAYAEKEAMSLTATVAALLEKGLENAH